MKVSIIFLRNSSNAHWLSDRAEPDFLGPAGASSVPMPGGLRVGDRGSLPYGELR